MSKRGYYGTNKTGYGLLYLELMCFDRENNTEWVMGLGSPSNYPIGHPKECEDNRLKMGSGFNKIKHTYIAHKNNYIKYKTREQCIDRMSLAKEGLESFGYEVELRFE